MVCLLHSERKCSRGFLHRDIAGKTFALRNVIPRMIAWMNLESDVITGNCARCAQLHVSHVHVF